MFKLKNSTLSIYTYSDWVRIWSIYMQCLQATQHNTYYRTYFVRFYGVLFAPINIVQMGYIIFNKKWGVVY